MTTKYYQIHKERLQKKHVRDIKTFLSEKKTKGKDFTEEEKEKKRQYYLDCNMNLSFE